MENKDIRIRINTYDNKQQSFFYGYITIDGDLAIPPIYEMANAFKEGLAAVGDENRMGYINVKGDMVIEPRFDEADEFSEGLAAVMINHKWGYIDYSGKIVIQPQFDSAFLFTEGVAEISIDGKYGFIDKTGNIIVPIEFDAAESPFPYHGILTMWGDGCCVCYDIKGKRIWPKE